MRAKYKGSSTVPGIDVGVIGVVMGIVVACTTDEGVVIPQALKLSACTNSTMTSMWGTFITIYSMKCQGS